MFKPRKAGNLRKGRTLDEDDGVKTLDQDTRQETTAGKGTGETDGKAKIDKPEAQAPTMSVQELLLLRKLKKRPQGVDAEKLTKGDDRRPKNGQKAAVDIDAEAACRGCRKEKDETGCLYKANKLC